MSQTAESAVAGAESGQKLVLGIDPGASTGVAHYHDGKLKSMQTIKPQHLERFLRSLHASTLASVQIVFEDSRLQSKVFSGSAKLSMASRMKVARDVGRIDAWCTLLCDLCEELRIPCLGISPKDKGGKLGADAFAHRTGWVGRTNEHERDSAMVAWPYRKGFGL